MGNTQGIEKLEVLILHVLPGVVDPRCHFREPGLTHKEDIGSGSASAALGGVTTFFEMPNTHPNTDSAERLAWKVARARETSWTDFAFFVGATNENADTLGALEVLEGCSGVKTPTESSRRPKMAKLVARTAPAILLNVRSLIIP